MTSSKLKTITFNNTLTNQSVTYPLPTKTSDLTNDSGYITSYTETDPIFSASAAAGITSTDISNWNGMTDQNVLQTLVDTSDNKYYSILFSASNGTSSTTTSTKKHSGFMYQPSQDKLTVGNIQIGPTSQPGNLTFGNITLTGTTSNTAGTITLPDDTGTVALTKDIPTVPTTVSSFTNDSGYQNSTQVQSAINTAIGNINSFEVEVVSSLPASDIKDHTIYFVPQAVNSSTHDEYMYINNNWELIGTTTVDLSGYLQKTEISDWAKAANKPSYTASEVGAMSTSHAANAITSANITAWNNKSDFSGSYNDLTNKPTIPTVPTNVSDFTNDAGYLTSYTEADPIFSASAAAGITSADISNWNAKSNFSGSYNDLTNKPTIPAATTVTNTLASGTLIATINGTNIYAPTYTNGDNLSYGG